ncbi:unnamed protein product [Prorocentrum cordatum]|uniref:Uncharacterized protein n=1 Tax=Prorocentrum cordatum TaxID=2364126 RepID=A0ABN9T0L8_9DINO|nr:unnamed protein product [Polarella glacialis]
MEAFRALVASQPPKPKRQKGEKAVIEEAVDVVEEGKTEEKPPAWALNQGRILQQLVGMVRGHQDNLHEAKDEIAQVRLQARMAHSVAEDAMEKVTGLEEQIHVTGGSFMTTETFEKSNQGRHAATPQDNQNKNGKQKTAEDKENSSRTVVVGSREGLS